MRSIGGRLLVILFATTGLVWLCAATWIYFGTRGKVEHVLDARLVEAARMVNSLVTDRAVDAPRAARLGAPGADENLSYERQLSCQIWSLNGTLVGRSVSAPASPLSQQRNGFSVSVVNNETWRSYAIENDAVGVRILVGDNVSMRRRLVSNVMEGLLIPGVVILPLLAFLTCLSVRRGLAPLRLATAALGARQACDLRPLPIEGEPVELRPVVGALNRLLSRMADTREREKNFIAFAAHEMRTPLAGLKTHAQLALTVEDDRMRDASLSQIVVGVDRTSRLVRQLLDLVTAEGYDPSEMVAPVDVGRLIRAVADDLAAAHRDNVFLRIDRDFDGLKLRVNPELFSMAIRNLLENAILHSPADGMVRCYLARHDTGVRIMIDDDGGGIAPDDLPRVTERFYRGRNKTAVGSGLGLSIVDAALALCGARVALRNRDGGGLSAEITITDPGITDLEVTDGASRGQRQSRTVIAEPRALEPAEGAEPRC